MLSVSPGKLAAQYSLPRSVHRDAVLLCTPYKMPILVHKLHFLHGVKITTFGKGRRILVRISNEIADKDAIKKSFAGNPTHHY